MPNYLFSLPKPAVESQKTSQPSTDEKNVSWSQTASNFFVDSRDFETSDVKQNAAFFDFNKGFKGYEPVILFSSEFSSLFSAENSLSDLGSAIKLKHDAKVLNIKTALDILSKSDFRKEIVLPQKQKLQDFIISGSNSLSEISKVTLEAVKALDISSHNSLSSRVSSNRTVGRIASISSNQEESIEFSQSFLEFLRFNGYINANRFSNTKIWQQSLVEIKKSLITHSQSLLGGAKKIINDNDEWKLYGVEKDARNTDSTLFFQRRIWFNPFINLPINLKDYFSGALKDSTIRQQALELFTTLDKSVYMDLSINSEINSAGALGSQGVGLKNTDLRKFANETFSSKILENYKSSGRDISIVANLLFKEFSYSKVLKNNSDSFARRLGEFGYTVSTSGDNFRMWDHLIGRFFPDVRDIALNPTGQGNSLVSFSQRAESSDYQILTLEKNRLTDNRTNFTPGNQYYVESSLNTNSSNNNDFSRLDNLVELTNKSIATFQEIYRLLGYEKKQDEYVKVNNIDFNIDSIVKKLSIVSRIYQACVDFRSNGDITRSQNFLKFDESKLKDLSLEESTGVRLASVICKAAMYPTDQFKQHASDLKSGLFLWLLSALMMKVQGTNSVDQTVTDSLKEFISYKIVNNTFRDPGKITPEQLKVAHQEVRTFVINSRTTFQKIDRRFVQDPLAEDRGARAIDTTTVDVVNNLAVDQIPDYVDSNDWRVNYTNFIKNRVFQVDVDKGLWKEIVDILFNAYKGIEVVNQTDSSDPFGGFTAYSGISRIAYLYACFDMILRIISLQTPEDLEAYYKIKITIQSNSVEEEGILLSTIEDKTLPLYFDMNLLRDNNSYIYNKKIATAIQAYKGEEKLILNSVELFSDYLKTLKIKLQKFKNTVSSRSVEYRSQVSSLFQSLQGLNEDERSSLFNLSMSREQSLMNRFILDEYKDRLNSNSTTESKLKFNPEFSKFSKGFSDFLSVNDIETISYDVLSSYFKSNEFQNAKSNNKKIISVGIPPKLFSSLRSNNASYDDFKNKVIENVIRVRIFKIDRLRPVVVYKPLQYLFEVNRFPTRMLENWDLNAIDPNDLNILKIPTKLFDIRQDRFRVCADYSVAFPPELYSSTILTESDKLSIYSNHVKSFLAEEYLRWLTDVRFDETRFYNFTSLTPGLSLITQQYKSYLDYLGSNQSGNLQSNSSFRRQLPTSTLNGTFTDPLSGKVYTIPIKNVSSEESDKFQDSKVRTEKSEKSITLNLDDTMNKFFENETILSDISDELRKRAALPKKFDRTFSILFDPDDFMVDEMVTQRASLQHAVREGLINKVNGIYQHRDTSPGDVTFDEYFITVEPYDFVVNGQR